MTITLYHILLGLWTFLLTSLLVWVLMQKRTITRLRKNIESAPPPAQPAVAPGRGAAGSTGPGAGAKAAAPGGMPRPGPALGAPETTLESLFAETAVPTALGSRLSGGIKPIPRKGVGDEESASLLEDFQRSREATKAGGLTGAEASSLFEGLPGPDAVAPSSGAQSHPADEAEELEGMFAKFKKAGRPAARTEDPDSPGEKEPLPDSGLQRLFGAAPAAAPNAAADDDDEPLPPPRSNARAQDSSFDDLFGTKAPGASTGDEDSSAASLFGGDSPAPIRSGKGGGLMARLGGPASGSAPSALAGKAPPDEVAPKAGGSSALLNRLRGRGLDPVAGDKDSESEEPEPAGSSEMGLGLGGRALRPSQSDDENEDEAFPFGSPAPASESAESGTETGDEDPGALLAGLFGGNPIPTLDLSDDDRDLAEASGREAPGNPPPSEPEGDSEDGAGLWPAPDTDDTARSRLGSLFGDGPPAAAPARRPSTQPAAEPSEPPESSQPPGTEDELWPSATPEARSRLAAMMGGSGETDGESEDPMPPPIPAMGGRRSLNPFSAEDDEGADSRAGQWPGSMESQPSHHAGAGWSEDSAGPPPFMAGPPDGLEVPAPHPDGSLHPDLPGHSTAGSSSAPMDLPGIAPLWPTPGAEPASTPASLEAPTELAGSRSAASQAVGAPGGAPGPVRGQQVLDKFYSFYQSVLSEPSPSSEAPKPAVDTQEAGQVFRRVMDKIRRKDGRPGSAEPAAPATVAPVAPQVELLGQARQLAASGRVQEAVNSYEALLERFPGGPETREGLQELLSLRASARLSHTPVPRVRFSLRRPATP